MKRSEFRNLIRRELIKEAKGTSYEAKLAEIEKQGKMVTLEAKIDALAEMIETKNNRLNLVNEDENLAELIDKKKIKEMQKEIKLLEKAKTKMEKVFEKMGGVRTEVTSGDTVDADVETETEVEDEVDEGFNSPEIEEGTDSTYEEDDVVDEMLKGSSDMRKPGDRGVEGGTEEERTLDMEPGNDPEELDEEFNLRKYIGENRLLK